MIDIVNCNLMVNLLAGSSVDKVKYPNLYKWDTSVRQYHDKYQYLIDAATYRLQRIQRGLLALPYPKYYNTQLLTLQVLKRKQEVGEVDQIEVDLYKNIDPCIATHFNRTFNGTWNIPQVGMGIGGSIFAFSTYFNFSIPTRFVLSVIPVCIDWIRISRDPINEQHSLDFLNWVIGYRKAKCFAERHHKAFNSQETRKILGNANLIELGNDLIKLAAK